jgi:hypothetical protein
MEQHYYIFREPTTFDELKALLLLRYKVFRESRLEKFVEENEACIDLDCYDLYSRHFGLYEHEGNSARPVGYIRMVTDDMGTFRDELFELAKSIPSLYEKVNRIPKEPFPLMNYCPHADLIKHFYEELKSDGGKLIEASRLSLDRSVRGTSISDFKIAHTFIAAVYASFLTYGVSNCVLSCNANHQVLYKSYGSQIFIGTTQWHNDLAGVDYSLLLLAAKNLPDSMKEKVYKMAEVYKKFGRICYNPSEPENYYAPLGSYMKSKPVFTPAVESDSQSDVYVEKEITESEKSICEMDSTSQQSVYETNSTTTIEERN